MQSKFHLTVTYSKFYVGPFETKANILNIIQCKSVVFKWETPLIYYFFLFLFRAIVYDCKYGPTTCTVSCY